MKRELPPRRTVYVDGSSIAPREKSEKRPLRVLGHFHSYPPVKNTGGSFTAHALMRHGQIMRGWDTQVVVDAFDGFYSPMDGVAVRRDNNVFTLRSEYMRSEVAITHLKATPRAVELSTRGGVPLVHLIHNVKQIPYYRVTDRNCALAIFNSQTLMDRCDWKHRAVVAHPLVRVSDYQTELTDDCIVMINMSKQKGAELFYDLATALPRFRFVGVTGDYDTQLPAPILPNLEIVPSTPDMKSVYARARLVLVPSDFETWGRVAIEAACSGIPAISTPTHGVAESMITPFLVPKEDFATWVSTIEELMMDDDAWSGASSAARIQAEGLERVVLEELNRACEAIENLV